MRNNWFFYIRNNLFEIWHFYSNLVVFATIETMSKKKGKKILVTHNQEYKKIKKKIKNSLKKKKISLKKKSFKKNWKIYAFFSRHETCLSILATTSCNFQFVNTHTYIYIVWSNHYTTLSVFLFCLYIK